MKAEENALAERTLQNYHRTKSPFLKLYYSQMLNAIARQVQYRMLTPEEEKELNNALAKLGGGRLTRRRHSKSIRRSHKSTRRSIHSRGHRG